MDATGKVKTKEYEVYQADLTPESVLFWRGQCEMFQGTAQLSKNLNISDDLRETKLESLIGPLVEFCERIEKVWRNSCADQTFDKDEQEEADVADMLGIYQLTTRRTKRMTAPIGNEGLLVEQGRVIQHCLIARTKMSRTALTSR